MSGLLLDTHAYVWAVTDPSKLSPVVLNLLDDAAVAVFVSVASVWEMAIKHRSGRWPEADPLLRGHDRIVSQLRAETLVVDAEDAVRAGGLAWDHRDPFDRILAAQSMRRGLRMLSRDEAFRDLPGLQVVW